MDLGLSGKAVVITGGGSGIGRAISEAFGRQRAGVVLSYLTSATESEATAASIVAAGAEAFAVSADVTTETGAELLIRAAVERFGRIDVVVANAGGLLKRAPIRETSRQLWDDVLAVNLTSVFLTCRAALPHMPEGASIIALTSLAAHDGGGVGASHYAAAKGGVMSYVRALAKELAPAIRVNGIAPGFIGTRFHDRFTSPEVRQAVAARTLLGREGMPGEVASAAVFLASSMATFITGEIVEVNGGLGMY